MNGYEMPEYVVLQRVKRETDEALRKSIQQVQSAFAAIRCIKEMPPLPKDLKQINTKFVEESIKPHLDAVQSDASLTEEEKENKRKQWQIIMNKATHQVKLIAEALDQWPDVAWQWDELVSNFVASNIDSVVLQRSTFPTPLESKQHYNLIRECYDSVKRLREWESKMDCKTIPLMSLTRYTAQQIAEAWLSGDAVLCHKYDALFKRVGITNESYKGVIIF